MAISASTRNRNTIDPARAFSFHESQKGLAFPRGLFRSAPHQTDRERRQHQSQRSVDSYGSLPVAVPQRFPLQHATHSALPTVLESGPTPAPARPPPTWRARTIRMRSPEPFSPRPAAGSQRRSRQQDHVRSRAELPHRHHPGERKQFDGTVHSSPRSVFTATT